MSATEEVLLKISGDSSGGEQALRRVGQALDPLKAKLDQVSKAGRVLGVVFGGLAAAGGKLIQSTAQVAMRNEVLALSLYTVGRNAGYTQDELDVLVDRVKALGITTSMSRLSLTRMIQSQLDLAKATDLARTAQNLAGIAEENSSETYDNLMQAITSLQPVLLRQYGIVTTVNQVLGDLSNSTDSTAKRARFLEFVLEEGARVAGVYEEAMGVVGKRITSLPRLIEEAEAAFGKHFIPIVGKGVDMLSAFLKWFEKLPEGVQRALAMVALFGTGLSTVAAAAGGLMATLPFILSGLSAMSGLLSSVGPIIAAVAAAVTAVAGAAAVAVRAWNEDWGGLHTTVEKIWGTVKPLLSEMVALVAAWGGKFREQINAIGGAFTTRLAPAFRWLANLIASFDWRGLTRTLKDAINTALGLISAMLETIQGLLEGKGLRSFLPLKDAMIDVLTLIALTWQKYIAKALNWGWNLVVNIANGIIRAAQSVLVAAMRFVGNIIGAFVAPGSPPKKGPLSHIVEWGKGLINTYLRSFALADFGLLRDALSPIRDALEGALAAGDIDEAGFVQLFGRVREQVAGLVAEFRRTGEIGEEALGKIAESLGPGSDELVKYLRLQLEHRKALDHLSDVQKEVAEAEAAGFVPAALKAKLKAAETSADTAKDELDWQREYLAMQQESVDLQLRLVDVLDKLSDAMDKLAGEEGAGEGIAEALADLAGLDLSAAAGDLGAARAELGGMSEEFRLMRAQVVAFLGLPLDQKIGVIAQKLTDMTGIDFVGFWERVQRTLKRIDEEGLLSVLREWAQNGLDYVKKNWPKWSKDISDAVTQAFTNAVEKLMRGVADLVTGLTNWFGEIISGLFTWVSDNHDDWGTDFAYWLGQSMARLLMLLTIDIPIWIAKLTAWLGNIIGGLLDWLATDAPRIGRELWNNFAVALGHWLDHMWTNLPHWIGELLLWAGDLLRSFAQGFLDNAPEWLANLVNVGYAIVNKIWEGIRARWEALVKWFLGKLQDLADLLPWSEPKDPRSPLRHLAESGKAITENLAAGIDFSPIHSALRGELLKTQRALATAGVVGGTTIYQSIEGGLNFPNVRDGRDALGVRRGIDRMALEASMAARTQVAPVG